jgi:hypothetical protein
LRTGKQVFIGNTTGERNMKTPWVFKAGARRALLYGMLILCAALTPPLILIMNSLT